MKELLEMQGLENTDFFGEIDKLSVKEKVSFIRNEIIPAMNTRRGRSGNIGPAETHQKLLSSDPDKPGEIIELMRELIILLTNRHMPLGIGPEMAGEFADIAYYGLQPNVDFEDSLKRYDHDLFAPARIPIDSILAFCIIKYSTRLMHGEESNYKYLERDKLQEYLFKHPDLGELWNPINATKRPDTIWEHVGGFESRSDFR